jgi:hypothetical protein
MEQQISTVGKKIFLLYPHSVIRDEMLDWLIMAGYETYTVVNEKKALKLLEKFPGSIMFVNIDDGLKEDEWETYIRGILGNPKTKDTRLGIMSYNQDQKLMKKYLMELVLPCGYIQLKLGFEESKNIILHALEANEAQGRRKCIRADCENDINAIMNFKDELGLCQGKILDISSTGIAARILTHTDIPANSLVRNVQLKLRGGILMSDMIVMGKRMNDKTVYVMLFASRLSEDDKLIIHRYIKQCLQKYMDSLRV